MKNKIKSFNKFIEKDKLNELKVIGPRGKGAKKYWEESERRRKDKKFNDGFTSISVDSEENLPTIDIDRILYDYASSLNSEEKLDFAKKLSMHVQYLRSPMARDSEGVFGGTFTDEPTDPNISPEAIKHGKEFHQKTLDFIEMEKIKDKFKNEK